MSFRHVSSCGIRESTSVPVQNPAQRLDRRTLLKATAAFVAMATASGAPVAKPRSAVAQEASTQAGEWRQPDDVGGGDTLGFEADFPFNAVAPNWPGDTPFPAAVEIELSMDGQTWSESVVVGPAHTDAGPPDRDGRIFGDLLFTEEARMVRYRGLDTDGNEIAIPGLTFTYINAKAGPRLSDVTASSLNPSSNRPPIIAREEWGAERAYGGADRGEVEWPPSYQTVRHVIIHHSDTPRFRDPLVEIRSIHYYHAITRGWGDIGYNYLVDYMGNVYEGRVGGENAIGGHAFQYAHGSAGICSMGNFSLETSTPEAIAGLTWITSWAGRDLDPLSQRDFHETPNLPTICGHRDVVNSTCPGDGLYADLATIRWAVADVLAGAREVLNDPQYSPGQTIEATAEGGNMRALPGTGQSVAATVPLGAVMHIVDGPTTVDGYNWYEVTGNRGTGWMASTLFGASDAAPPIGSFSVDQMLEVDTNFLNIRAEPSLRSSAIATVPYGTKGSVIDGPLPAGGYRWYQLDTSYGSGWAVEQYLVLEGQGKPRTRFMIGDAVAVNQQAGLRIRTAPGLGTSVLATLPNGTRGVVIGSGRVSDSITWLEIQTPLGTGWVGEPYLAPSESGPATSSKFEPGDSVRVDTDAVNLRRTPGTDGSIVRSLGAGIVGTVIDGPSSATNMWWVRVDTDFGPGWVTEAFLAPADEGESSREFNIDDNIYIDTDGINIRTTPGLSSSVVTILYRSETGRVVAGPRSADGSVWYQIETSAHTGWGVSQYLGTGAADPGGSTGISIGDVVAVDTDGIRLRETPGLSGSWLTTIYSGEEGTVVDGPRSANGYVWLKLRVGAAEGWGAALYLTRVGKASLTIGGSARVVDGDLNLRAEPGPDQEILGVLADGAVVEVLDGPRAVDGYEWFRVSSSRFGAGWSVSEYLARN